MANLITLDDYKTAKKITGFGDDVRLEELVTSVSQLVKTYCNNTFVDFFASDKTEIFNIDFDNYTVSVDEVPLTSVVSVEERDSISSSYATLVNDSDYYVDFETDSILRSNGSNGYKNFAKGPGAVKVTYRGGYAACPADLKLAVVDLISYYHKDEHKQRQTLSGASIQNQGTSGQSGNVGFPDHIKRILDLYKNF